ncbi:MAG TPA: MBL fold metallo-hydrolase [Vicinamibacterales bacterium]|nr:MBL fold metallo-hydrolase [Vicinamibacterales bacterium]
MWLIPAGNASEWTGPTGNNTYLFPGAPSALIDAGVGNPEHVDAIARALSGGALGLVLITHGHVDHVAGVPALTARWPGAVVRGGGAGEPLRDGEVFEPGGVRLRAVQTPGHAPDHFCFFEESSRDLYCGDLARRGGTVVIPASRGGNLREYLDALRRVRGLQPARLLPAHGPIVDDPAALIDEYIAHRELRDREIRAALAAGCRTPAEIVARVYPGLPPALSPAAEDTVRAHLLHLDEG